MNSALKPDSHIIERKRSLRASVCGRPEQIDDRAAKDSSARWKIDARDGKGAGKETAGRMRVLRRTLRCGAKRESGWRTDHCLAHGGNPGTYDPNPELRQRGAVDPGALQQAFVCRFPQVEVLVLSLLIAQYAFSL
jgi:hypothetical protein